jgi:hypothetical protein
VAEGAGADLEELLLHFAGEAADGAVVEPVGDRALFGLFQAIDGALLLVEIAGVFDFGFDGFEFVAGLGGERERSGRSNCRAALGRADEGVCPYVSVAPGRRGVCAYVSLNLDGCETMPLKVERDVD